MILFGCLLAFGAAAAPRIILILAWIFSGRWPVVWQDNFVLPLLGIIFLPYTTIMYLLVVAVGPGGNVRPLEGFDWIWILLGLVLDFMKWGQMLTNRREAQAQASTYAASRATRTPTDSTPVADVGTPASATTPEAAAMVETTAPSAATTPGPADVKPAERIKDPDKPQEASTPDTDKDEATDANDKG